VTLAVTRYGKRVPSRERDLEVASVQWRRNFGPGVSRRLAALPNTATAEVRAAKSRATISALLLTPSLSSTGGLEPKINSPRQWGL